MRANPKKMAAELSKNRKVVTAKDIINIKYKANANDKINTLEEVESYLKNEHGAHVIALVVYGVFKALYVTTDEMQKSFNNWPEMVAIDGTYQLNNKRLPLYIFLSKDSLRKGVVICFGLLSSEDEISLQWLFEAFKNQNIDACRKTKYFMSDKHELQRKLLKSIFPGKPVYICRYRLNKLPTSIYQLLLQCIGIEHMHTLYPNSICKQCCENIKSFDDFQNQTKKSNSILRDLLGTHKNDCEDVIETVEASLDSHEKLDDPLNCVEGEKKNETVFEVFAKDFPTMQNGTNIKNETNKAELDDVIFSPGQNDEIICKYGCGTTFPSIFILETHYREKHIKKEIIGVISGKNYSSSTIEEETGNEDCRKSVAENKYTCKVCLRKYVDRSTLIVHSRLHLEKLPFQCGKCERSFNKKIRLTKHLREMHGETPLALECNYGCGKIFNRYHALDDHHYRHRNNKLETSSDCTKTKKDNKSNVRRKETSSQNVYVCEDCGQVLLNITKFREHSYKHRPPEERPYKCEHCDKTFIVKRSYEEHLMRHAGIKNFECKVCGLKRSTRRELVKHMNIHTKEARVNCPICSKAYADPKTLKRHIETVHQRLRKYICRYCNKAFAKCDVRNRHEVEHGAERPYKCKFCNEGFFLISKLGYHIATAHKNNTMSTSAGEKNTS